MSHTILSKTTSLLSDPLEVIVCSDIGDATSPDGKKLHRIYDTIINTPLQVQPLKNNLPKIASYLTKKFPWAREALNLVLGEIAQKEMFGDPRLSGVLKPFLLVGPPGCGKTKFATELSHILGLPMDLLSGSVSDTGGLQAVSRGWASTLPCGPLVAMQRHQCANPVLLIDEIDKAKGSKNNGHIWTTLLSMLNGDGNYFDSCLITNIDLRFVNFWATANDLSGLPSPLLDRFIIIQIPSPNIEHADDIIDSVMKDHLAQIGSKTAPELPILLRQKLATLLTSKTGSIRKMQQAYADWLRAQALQRALPNLDLKCSTIGDVLHLPHQNDRVH